MLRAHTSAYFDSLDDIPSLNLVTSLPPRAPLALACTTSSAQPSALPPSLNLSSSSNLDAAEPGLAAKGPAEECSAGPQQVNSAPVSLQADGVGDAGTAGNKESREARAGVTCLIDQAEGEWGNADSRQGSRAPDQDADGEGDQGARVAEQDGPDAPMVLQLPVVMFPERAQAQVAAFLRAHRQRITDLVGF